MKYGFLASLMAVSAFAHGGAEHVMGVAKEITAESITVETPKHELVTILMRKNTEVKKSSIAASMSDLKVGDRVVVHAEKNKEGKLEAEEVEFGALPAKK